MPVESVPLFRPEILRPRLAAFEMPANGGDTRDRLQGWVRLLDSTGMEQKETELLPDFLTDVFQRILGYRGPAEGAGAGYTISREKLVEVDGKFADAVLGTFAAVPNHTVVAVEGKGPKDPLDRPFGGRRMSAVDQAYRYAINLPCDWLIVTNLKEIRLYHKGSTQRSFERFVLRDLAKDESELRRFVFILGVDRVVPRDGRSHLYDLLDASEKAGERLTQEFYRSYSEIRHALLSALLEANPDVAPADVLSAAQRLLDRTLFIAFAEDRSLLPPDTLSMAYEHRNPYNPRPIWHNFQGLFRAIDRGNEALGIPQYNGGLFAEHPLLDQHLAIPDDACERLKRLGDYHYGVPSTSAGEGEEQLVDVEILGHIFEQSIEDLEAIRAEIEGGGAVMRATSRRKREGAFYTPAYVTRYIVANTLRPILDERFERVRQARIEAERKKKATGTATAVLDDPRVYDIEKLNNPRRDALIAFWEAWIEELKTIRAVDPACGSGAFLLELFDQLHLEYQQAVDRLVELRRGGFAGSFFDPDRTILQHNIYGVDLNEEAIEIAKLSIWIKTAQRGKVLTDLDHNIRVGNSIIDDPEVDPRAFRWWEALPEVAEQRGFDVVVGNPPYVRAEMLTPIKPYLQEHYETYHGAADLYVYFYELGVRLLRPGGRMSYIVTNKWLRAGYAEPLRAFFSTATWVEEIVDLGHAKEIFPDADVFPSLVRVRKPAPHAAPDDALACVIPRDNLRTEDLGHQVGEFGFRTPRESLGSEAWTLEPSEVLDLLRKIKEAGRPLRDVVGNTPYRGVMTGYNAAFTISEQERAELVSSDPGSAHLFRRYARGQDVRRWSPEWSDAWLIVMQSSGDFEWPWASATDEADAEQVFAATYPAVHRHFRAHETRLRARKDQGRYWWELRSCDYYRVFDQPKIIYQEIQYHPSYALDVEQAYPNNKCFSLRSDSLFLLALLNAPVIWWYNWRTLPHMKDEALSPVAFMMENLPVPEPSASTRQSIEEAATQLIDITRRRQERVASLHDWLRVEFGIEKPGQKLNEPHEIDSDEFVTELKKRRPGKSTVSSAELQRLRDEYQAVIIPLQDDARRALTLEGEISDLVNGTYGLTSEEVDLLWQTAPPRMPAVGRRTEPTTAAVEAA
jgi:hypothetical protein